MANPGTAVSTLWNVQTGKKVADNSSLTKNEEVQTANQETKFNAFFKDGTLQELATETGIVIKSCAPSSKVTAMATLVSSLSSINGSIGSSNSQGMVTAFISSRPTTVAKSTAAITQISTPIAVASAQQQQQPLLLPKPSVPQRPIIPTTPPRVSYIAPNPSVLTSPLYGTTSPSQQWNQFRKNVRPDFDVDAILDSKRRRTPNKTGPEKGGKGLRHFSMKVCEKVQQKGVTSYNEVADELVQEFSEQSQGSVDQSFDQKNIRRRVYDALNVLMAMNIISKEKKEIKWVGLPTNSVQECKHLEDQKHERIERIKQKQQQLKELIVQQIAFKNLVERNKVVEKKEGQPQSNACIHLPFIIVNTSKKTVIDCSISSDKSEYLFNFDEAFEIHDDIEVLKRMGLSYGLERGECDDKQLKLARGLLPKSLQPYVTQMANGTYGDLELLELERSSRNSISPLATPLSLARNSISAKSTRGKKRSATTGVSGINSKIVRTSSPSVTSEYDESENDGDDENGTLVDA